MFQVINRQFAAHLKKKYKIQKVWHYFHTYIGESFINIAIKKNN